MTRIIASSLAVVFVLGFTLLADDKKEATVKEIELKGLKRDNPNTKYDNPTVIKTEDDLKKAFPEEETQTAVKKEIDFGKNQILFFAWSGSGQDALSYEVNKDNPNEVIFKFTPGRTKDFRSHFHAYMLPKVAKWKFAD
jgi:hypothetical protein